MKYLAAILLALLPFSVFAVQPDEMLDDPELETRAREISKGLRCLVCRNESIDESNAELARDLRLLVRDRLLAGDTDAEVRAFLVARYGEFVLLRPTASGMNVILWAAGPAMLLIGATVAVVYLRRRARIVEPQDRLTAEEQARLDRLLDE